MKKLHRSTATAAAAALAMVAGACGDDGPTGPTLTRAEVAATYNLTALTFDPQGSLPEIDLAGRLSVANPSLQLTGDGVAQLSFRDPETNLLVTVNGAYTTGESDVRVRFEEGNDAYRRLFLSRTMTFEFQSGGSTTLRFVGDPGTISRARLLELAPELEGEQLLDPVPGELEVSFRA